MKLRLMIGWCALAATVALGEDVTGKNVCGLMNVPSKAEVTMIAVPWVTVGGSADAMKVADLVKTDTLSENDELYYYDGGVYRCWKLSADRKWEPATVTLKDAKGNPVTIEAPGDSYTLPRGKGLFLVRSNTEKEIWLYGQYSTEKVSVTVAKGEVVDGKMVPAYTMIANPNTADYDLNTKGVGGAEGDLILLDDAKTLYRYKDSSWKKQGTQEVTMGEIKKTLTTWVADGCVIPAGRGAWYVSKGGQPTIKWN